MSGIQFFHSLGGSPQTILETVVNKYNEKNEEQVILVYKDGGSYAAAVNEVLDANPFSRPNLVLVPEFMTGRFKLLAQQGDCFSVYNMLDEDRSSMISSFVRKTFGEYAVPLNPACGILYVNENALEKIGYNRNWRPSTFEELKKVSGLMVAQKVVDHGWSTAWPEAYLVEVVLAQSNLPLVTPENGEQGYGDYNFSQLADHIFELWSQKQEGIFLPPATGNYDPSRLPFIEGKIGFYMQGSGHSERIRGEGSNNSVSVGFSALPTLSKDHTGPVYAFPLGGAAIWTLEPKDPSLTQEARDRITSGVRKFLNYIASSEAQEYWHVHTGYVPVSKDVFDRLKANGFYNDHPVHEAVVEQTICREAGENSFGIKMPNYGKDVRSKVYPMIHSLLHLEGSPEQVKATIRNTLKEFDHTWSIPKPEETP